MRFGHLNAVPALRSQGRTVIGMAVVGTVLSQGAAMAKAPDDTIPSLTSDTTYFLFRNDFDYMQTPARLGLSDQRALYTMLSNIPGAGSSFSLGGRTPLGSGSLGIFAAVGANRSVEMRDTTVPGDASSGDHTEAVSNTAFSRALIFYGGYGWKRGDMSLGLGLKADMGGQDAESEVSESYTDFDPISGDISHQYQSHDVANTNSAFRSVKVLLSGSYGARAGALWVGNLTFQHYGYSSSLSSDNSRTESETDVYSSSNDDTYSQTYDGASWLLGLELNPEFQVSPTFGLEFFGAARAGRLGNQSHEEETEDYAYTTDSGYEDAYSTSSMMDGEGSGVGLELVGWAAGRFQLSQTTELRMGVGYTYRGEFADQTSTLVVADTSTSPSDPPGTSVNTGTSAYGSGALLLPVALAVHATDHLIIRAGARYGLYRSALRSEVTNNFTPADPPGEVVTGSSKQDHIDLGGGASYSLGLEYRPASPLRLSVAFVRWGDESRVSLGSLGLYSSASLEW